MQDRQESNNTKSFRLLLQQNTSNKDKNWHANMHNDI